MLNQLKERSSLIKVNLYYSLLAIFLFAIETLIALYAHDQIIRPFLGDVLVVILLYCLIKSFLNTPVFKTAVAVLAFSFVVELLQYFHFVKLIGLEKSATANILMGNYFTWTDLLAYTLGILIVLIVEWSFFNSKYFSRIKHRSSKN